MNRYNVLFDDNDKIKAFDMIAEHYFCRNFGTMQKSDLELLLFYLYFEQVLKKDGNALNAYSDYALSKELGITQSRISALKVKKDLKYQSEHFNWKEEFKKSVQYAQYDEKTKSIKINIPDKTMFYELQNIVEKNGGFIDKQLNSKILQLNPAMFVSLLLEIVDEKDKEQTEKKLKNILKENNQENTKLIEEIEKIPFKYGLLKATKDKAPEAIVDIACSLLEKGFGGAILETVKTILKILKGASEDEN